MNRILVVDDEKPIASLVRISLGNAGYQCEMAFDGEEALEMIGQRTYDLILLDIMMPQIDGMELLEYIRPLGIPVIFMTAKSDLKDRVKGLRSGAEDYIVKPFEIPELIARVEVVLRRYRKAQEQFDIDGLHVDIPSRRVEREGAEIQLTPKEFDLLVLFLRTPNTALYRETIYERVWEGEMEFGSKTVDLHVQRLRRKTGLGDRIRSVSKVGYRLEMKI